MTKNYLLASIGAALSVLPAWGAPIEGIYTSPAKAPAEFTTTTPEGDYYVFERSGHSLMLDWEGIMLMPVDNFVGEIVYGEGNTAYVRNPLTYVNNNVWVEGTVNAERTTITIPAGSVIAEDPWNHTHMALFNALFKVEDGQAIVVPDQTSDITYTISSDGATVSLDNTYLSGELTSPEEIKGIGAFTVENDFEWAGFLDFETVYSRIDISRVVPPAELATSECSLVSINPNSMPIDLDNLQGTMVNVGVVGNDIYVQGLANSIPEAWVKGSIEGEMATFDNAQFVAVTNGYMLYFTPATHETTVNPDWGFTTTTFTPTEKAMTFKWDASQLSLTDASSDILISTGVNIATAFNQYIEPVIRKFEDVAATPKTPAITSVNQWPGEGGDPYYGVAIRTSDFDVDGAMMNRDQLYYRVYVDDELFTFTPEEYPTISEAMTDVPFSLSTDDFLSSANYQSFYIFRPEVKSIGVEVIYKGGALTTPSGMAIWGESSIGSVNATQTIIDAPVFNLQGQRVDPSNLAPGIYIKGGKKIMVN